MLNGFADHDVAGRNEIQEFVVQVEEPRRVRQRLSTDKGKDLCDAEIHFVQHATTMYLQSSVQSSQSIWSLRS